MNRRTLGTAWLATLAAACPPAHTGPLPDDVRRAIDDARAQAETGDRAAAAKRLVDIAQQSPPESAAAVEALFAGAEIDFAANDCLAARAKYQDLLARFPLFDRSDRAKLHLGVCHGRLGEARDALTTLAPLYGPLSAAEKPAIAATLAQSAAAAGAYVEAVRWAQEAARVAPDEASLQAALDRALAVVDSRLTFLEVAQLAEELPDDLHVRPMLRFKLARVYAHLRDYPRLRESLRGFLSNHPESPFAADARAMLDRADRRIEVKPDAVGVVLPLSGKYQGTGEAFLRGINLALAGAPTSASPRVTLVIKDSAGDAVQAKKAITELASDDQVIAILGPVMLTESGDAATEAELQEVPIVTFTRLAGVTELGPHVFRNMITDEDQARGIAEYALKQKGLKRFALLYPNVQYGAQVANAFWDAAEAAGAEIRGAETYEPDTTTFNRQVKNLVGRLHLEEREEFVEAKKQIQANIKDPYRQSKALADLVKRLEPIVDFDALVVPDSAKNVGLIAPALAVEDIFTTTCDPKEMEKIAKTLNKKPEEMRPVLLLGGSAWNSPDLVQYGGKFVECSVFVDGFFAGSDRPATRRFVQAFRALTATPERSEGRDPNLLEAIGYDTGLIVRHVVEKERPTTRGEFREALLRIRAFPGATGTTTFRENREATRPLFFLTVEKGAIREVVPGGGA